MRMILNRQVVNVADEATDEPLLYLLRDQFNLNGPRYGCGVGSCGACTVIIDGEAQRSCVVPVEAVEGCEVMTLEGLEQGALHPLQEAWIAEGVPQCGYCQNGQIMTAYALLAARPNASATEIETAMDAVLCRCGTHSRIRRAIDRAQSMLREQA